MMMGGLPAKRTPLNARVTGNIQMDGFHIEKLIFESLPKIYVTALLYVPEDGSAKHPAILVPAGHAPDGKTHYQILCQRLVSAATSLSHGTQWARANAANSGMLKPAKVATT